jgi:hypothetical protein
MAAGLYSGASGLALGTGLYKGVSGLWGGASGLINGFGGGEFSPASLFTAGEGGFWLDPSDLTSMRQLSTGETAVTAAAQPVGFIADKRLMGGKTFDAFVAGQPELVTNGGPFTTTTGWTAFRSTLSVSGTSLRVTEDGTNSANYAQQTITTVAGTWYYITVELTAISGPSKAQLWVGTSAGAANLLLIDGITTPRVITALFLATSTSTVVELVQNTTAGGTSEFTEWNNISIKAIPGNHFLQATAAKRPILQQDAQGFYYLQGDGTDDVLNSGAAVAPLGADKSQGFIGVYMDSNAVAAFPMGTSPSPASGGTTAPSNPGSWGIRMPNSTGASIASWPCQGTVRIQPSFSTSTLTKYALSGLMDIAAPSLVVRRNAAEVINSTASMGTGTFLSYSSSVLATATGFFPGRVYQAICRFGPNLDAATITQTENYVNSKTGAY